MTNWCENYRPTSLSQYVDVYGHYQLIIDWIRNWTEEGKQRFAILHGKPGTGKSTIVMAIANDLGLELHMTNASNDRNKENIIESWQTATMKSLSDKKRLVVLDEADHISDVHRGKGKSPQDIVMEMVKNCRCPVILICNDIYRLNRSLRGRDAFKFQFDYPNSENKIKLANYIIAKEKIDITVNEIPQVIAISKTYRSLIHNLQKAAMKEWHFNEDVIDEGLFDEFQSILEGHAPEKTNFEPDELMKWMVEYVPNHFDKILIAYRALGRVRGELYTTGIHDYAYKYSNSALRLCRGKIVDEMLNGRKLILPMESMQIQMKIKTEKNVPVKKDKENGKITEKVDKPVKKKVEKSDGLSKWA